MIRFDEDKKVLWIQADDYDQAWDAYHENPIPVPDIKALVIEGEISHFVRGEPLQTFLKEKKSALTEIMEENRERQYVHILPFAADTGKFQFLLTSPLKMWDFEIDRGLSPETAAVQRSEEIIEREIEGAETLIGVLREEEGKHVHYFFLLILGEEFQTPTSTVWIARDKFDDWKWDPKTQTMIENQDVTEITTLKSPYEKLVSAMTQ